MAERWEKVWTSQGGLKRGAAFDANQPLPFIETLFKKDLIPAGKGLVPGCGRAYAVQALARDGRHVTGLDIAPSAVAAAKKFLEEQRADAKTYSVAEGSFFDLEDSFNFAYDYTFLCALPPAMRLDWAKTYARIIAPGGVLVTVIFPIKPTTAGHPGTPPFELTEELVESLLVPHGFSLVFKKPLGPGEAHPGRDGEAGAMASTVIAVWKKKTVESSGSAQNETTNTAQPAAISGEEQLEPDASEALHEGNGQAKTAATVPDDEAQPSADAQSTAR